MVSDHTLEERVAERYSGLSEQLRKAADYVLSHPLDVASRSLRAISSESKVSPATYSRLSRALGYDNFENVRDISRLSVGQKVVSLSVKAERLRSGKPSGQSMLARQSQACIANIESFQNSADNRKLEQAAALMRKANQVVLLGALASTGFTEYMSYIAQFFGSNWTVGGRMGASLGSEIAKLGKGDVVFAVTMSPYARRAIGAVKLAREAGADVVLITDALACPGLAHATHGFIVPTESPQFFSSYAVTIVLIETLLAMIVATSEADVTAAIQRVEANNQVLGEYLVE